MHNSLLFTVTHPDAGTFKFRIFPKRGVIDCSRALEGFQVSKLCPECRSPKDDEYCWLFAHLHPVFLYFSKLKSYDPVRFSFCRENVCEFEEIPAAKAGFIISQYATMYSGCAFFGAFKEIGDYCRFTIAEESLLFPIVAHQIFMHYFNGKALDVPLEQCVSTYLDKQRVKLTRIMESCKPFAERDGMVNALNALYSFTTLASMSLTDFMARLMDRYRDGPALDC